MNVDDYEYIERRRQLLARKIEIQKRIKELKGLNPQLVVDESQKGGWDIPDDFLDIIVGYDLIKDMVRRVLKTGLFGENFLLIGPPACITPDEKVVIRQAGIVDLIPIGRLYDIWLNGSKFEALSINPKTMKPEWKLVYDMTRWGEPPDPVVKYVLRGGISVKATGSHKFVYYERDDDRLGTITGNDLNENYPIPVLNGNGVKWKIHSDIGTWDMGFFTGFWLAEGTFIKKENAIDITNADKSLLENIKLVLKKYFGSKQSPEFRGGSLRKTGEAWALRTIGSSVVKYCQGFIGPKGVRPLGVKGCHSERKKIPSWVFTETEEFRKGLLCGYFTGDGSISRNSGLIEATTVSRDLRDGVGFMLIQLGIMAGCRDRVNGFGGVYSVCVNRDSSERFLQDIGFAGKKGNYPLSGYGSAEHEEITRVPLPPGNFSYDIHRNKYERRHVTCNMANRCKNPRLNELMNSHWGVLRKKEVINYVGPVYDMGVKDNHNFILSNGLVLSNCGKSIWFYEIQRLTGVYFASGSSTSGAGLTQIMFERKPRIVILDECDKIKSDDLSPFLHMMETGVIQETKVRGKSKGGTGRAMKINPIVFAAANDVKRLTPEFRSRFVGKGLFLKEYSEDEFTEIVVRVLTTRFGRDEEVARYIARRSFSYDADVREAIRCSKLSDNIEQANQYFETLLTYGDD